MSGSKKQTPGRLSPPSVTFKEELAGRETLAAIAEDLASSPYRRTTSTQHYNDRISNAPGAMSPKKARAIDGSPELSVSFDELSAPKDSPGQAQWTEHTTTWKKGAPIGELAVSEENKKLKVASLVIHQVHTFVVEGNPMLLSSEESQRALVHQRLIRQMPGCSPDDIQKMEFRAGSQRGTAVVRVWTRVP